MIKVSELIKQLQEFQEKHGDLPVIFKHEGYGGYAMNTILKLDNSVGKIDPDYIDMIEDNDQDIKELFPQWSGDSEDFFEGEFNPAKCAVLKHGKMLYAT